MPTADRQVSEWYSQTCSQNHPKCTTTAIVILASNRAHLDCCTTRMKLKEATQSRARLNSPIIFMRYSVSRLSMIDAWKQTSVVSIKRWSSVSSISGTQSAAESESYPLTSAHPVMFALAQGSQFICRSWWWWWWNPTLSYTWQAHRCMAPECAGGTAAPGEPDVVAPRMLHGRLDSRSPLGQHPCSLNLFRGRGNCWGEKSK